MATLEASKTYSDCQDFPKNLAKMQMKHLQAQPSGSSLLYIEDMEPEIIQKYHLKVGEVTPFSGRVIASRHKGLHGE